MAGYWFSLDISGTSLASFIADSAHMASMLYVG